MIDDFDTWPQINSFDEYLKETGEDRQKYNDAFGYGEEEWESFQAGWNAAKKYFEVKE